MIYPKKINARKTSIMLNSFAVVSILIAILLIVINKLTTPNIHWAALSNAGIVYLWITVIYSINKNINIAAHVMIQTLAISLLTFYIDYKLGMTGWSLSISIPIIIIIANVTMLVLTIVSSRRYIRYAIFQLIILCFSTLPAVFIYEDMIQNRVLSYVATGIAAINFIITVCLSAGDVKDEVIRKFHL